MLKSKIKNQKSKIFFALAVLLTLLGLGLRFYRLSSQSLWTDEISSISVAQAPLGQVYEQSASLNNSLPTYFLLLRAVLDGARTNVEFKARALSALGGGLSIPVFMGVIYLWRRRTDTALLGGLLLAINPLHIWYSQEARAYGLMLFFGLLSLLFFELGREQRRRWCWGLYVVCAVAALALHKTGLVFPIACGLWQGWQLMRGRKDLRPLLIHAPIAIAALLLLLLKSYPPAEGYGRRASGLELVYAFMTFAGGYSFGPSLTDIQTHGPLVAVTQHVAQVGILAAVLLLVGLACALNYRTVLSGPEAALLVLGFGVVVVYGLLAGFPFNVRYALPALFGFLALMAAVSTGSSRPGLPCVALAGLVVVAVWADAQWFFRRGYGKADSRGVAGWLLEQPDKSWTVLPGYLSRSVEWYLQSDPKVLARSCPAKEDRTTSFPPVPDVLIIGRRHHLLQPDQLITAYQSAAGAVRTNGAFTGFELYVRRATESHGVRR